MTRSSLRVRPAEAADLPALVALGDELREQLLPSGDSRSARTTGALRLSPADRYTEALADPERHLVVVIDERSEREQCLGMALLTVAPSNALLDLPAVHMSHGVVADRHRRRGAGRALVAAAAAFAASRGVDQIVVSLAPGARDANRFFARLGFTPVAVRRVASVAAVRRKLAGAEPEPELQSRRSRGPVRLVGVPRLPLGPSTVPEDLVD